VFIKHGVLSDAEIESRYEILLENYIKTINIEALTMISMAKGEILPTAFRYAKELADAVNAIKTAGATTSAQEAVLAKVSTLAASINDGIAALEAAVSTANSESELFAEAKSYQTTVISAMEALRASADDLETVVAKDAWPFPNYSELLFSL